jgi:peptidoglycan/xylan/chitin deacetylase (PgdA/CDA1 family)
MGVKDAALAAMTHDALVPLWRPFVNDLVVALMLHRFNDPEHGGCGHSIAELRSNLAFLRRHRFHLASLDEMVAPDDPERPVTAPTVVFTIDDGYADFATVAAPVFAEFDCPATVFVVTGAIDQTTWMWWDRVELAVEGTKRMSVELRVAGAPMRWSLESPLQRRAAINSICEALKIVPDGEKERLLSELERDLDADLPAMPPPRYAAMSWSDVRRCAGNGITFAPHTVTHPMLPQVDDAKAEWEITESWQRLREECDATVPVFCYPNGAYTHRDVSILSRTGLVAAVTTQPRYASRRAFHTSDDETRFGVPRFSYVDKREWFVQVVTGVERLKMALRGETWGAVGAGAARRPQ